MKVFINTRPLIVRKAGIGYYVENLVATLQSRHIELLFSHTVTEAKTDKKLRSISAPLKNLFGRWYPEEISAAFYDYMIDRNIAYNEKPNGSKRRVDIYHETTYRGLKDIDSYIDYGAMVLNIYDLSPFKMQEIHLKTLAKSAVKSADNVKKADVIIANTNYIADGIAEYFSIDRGKIAVVPSAAAYPYRNLGLNRAIIRQKLSSVLQNYNGSPFILYTGTIEPRKNLQTLIEAFAGFSAHTDCVLLLAGGFGWMYDQIINLPAALGIDDRVMFLGYQSAEIFELLYNGAEVFVYPSVYEGFGMPNIEAMMCGAPVVTSNTSCIPEVVGNAALLADPKSSDDFSFKIQKVLHDENLRNELVNKGIARASIYNWPAIGAQISSLYESLM